MKKALGWRYIPISPVPSEKLCFSCRQIFPVKKIFVCVEKIFDWVSVSDFKGLGLGRSGLSLEWSGDSGLGLGPGLGLG